MATRWYTLFELNDPARGCPGPVNKRSSGPLPSADRQKRPSPSLLLEVYTIRFPSGDQWGTRLLPSKVTRLRYPREAGKFCWMDQSITILCLLDTSPSQKNRTRNNLQDVGEVPLRNWSTDRKKHIGRSVSFPPECVGRLDRSKEISESFQPLPAVLVLTLTIR